MENNSKSKTETFTIDESTTNEPKNVVMITSNNKLIYNKSESSYRWLILFLSILPLMTAYYCNEIPISLSKELINDYNLTKTQYGLFYSVSNYPGIIMPFFVGILIDKIGTNIALLIFFMLHLVGQGLFVVGAHMNSLNIMLIGRGIFGVAGLTDLVLVKILALWFCDKEMATALSLLASFGRIGGIISINTLIPVYHELNNSISNTLWIGFGLLCIGLISVILLLIMDHSVSKEKEKQGYIVSKVKIHIFINTCL